MAFRRGVALLRQGLSRRLLASQPVDNALQTSQLTLEAPSARFSPGFGDEAVPSTSISRGMVYSNGKFSHRYCEMPRWGQARHYSGLGGDSGDGKQPGEVEDQQSIEGNAGQEEEIEEVEEELLNEKDYWPYPFPDELETDEDALASYLIGEDVRGIPGLPPYEDIVGGDTNEEEKEKRREKERKHQEEIAATRVQKIDEFGRAYATGRRKTSTARVWLTEGDGRISVNGKPYDKAFPNHLQRSEILAPLDEVGRLGVFDVRSTVKGGGIQGQAQAVRHGISRALQLFDPSLRSTLKSAGLLTRDPRAVERKKPGRKKARKSFQWVKR